MQLVFLFLVLFSSWCCCCGQALDRDDNPVCNYSVGVDQTHSHNCMRNSQIRLNNWTCKSLSHALQLISQIDRAVLAGSCVEVIISQGNYIIEGTMILDREVLLRGREGHVVSIILLTPATNPPEFTYSLSFRNVDFAGIKNIEFSGSNGVVGFDNVSMVEISGSSFRYMISSWVLFILVGLGSYKSKIMVH